MARQQKHTTLLRVSEETRGVPGDLVVLLNAQGRRIRGCAMAPGVPAAVVGHAFHPGHGYVLPEDCENVNHAV